MALDDISIAKISAVVHILDLDWIVRSFSPEKYLGVPGISKGRGTLFLKVSSLVMTACGMEGLRCRRMMSECMPNRRELLHLIKHSLPIKHHLVLLPV